MSVASIFLTLIQILALLGKYVNLNWSNTTEAQLAILRSGFAFYETHLMWLRDC